MTRPQMEYYITGQLALLDVKTGARNQSWYAGHDQCRRHVAGRKAFRITLLQKPFSYIVPMTNFAQTEEIWNASGKKVAELVQACAW